MKDPLIDELEKLLDLQKHKHDADIVRCNFKREEYIKLKHTSIQFKDCQCNFVNRKH